MPRKRLIVCCDGTQNDSVNTNAPLTNVGRLARCISNTASDGPGGELMNQIVYYQSGVGTGTSALVNSWDTIRGRGIESDIRQAYTFVCHNYWYEKDEIVLIGFSRGSFTVRALARLINDVGVLQKPGLRYLGEIFEHWVNQPIRPDDPLTARSNANLYVGIAGRYLTRNVRIKACAVWDTVAALPKDKLAFVDERMPPCLERAIQAVALNEERGILEPMLWKADPSESEASMNEKLRQCWFLGSHTDIYGEDDDGSLANISLAWILAQLNDIITFDEDTTGDIAQNNAQIARREHVSKEEYPNLHSVYELKVKYPVEEYQPTTDIQFNNVEKSERVAGWSIRKPFTSGPLTNEKVHWSVPELLDKKMVRKCKPLEKLEHKYRTAEVSDFEWSLIETWAAKDCLEIILDVLRREKAGDRDVNSGSANFVPTYAVLLKPEGFKLRQENIDHSTLEVHPKQPAGSTEGSSAVEKPIKRSTERSFKLLRVFTTKDEWVLSGSIEVPTASAVDLSSLDVKH